MAAPTSTNRSTPGSGSPMPDGYQTLIAFEDDPDVSFWEKTVQPPGVDGGDPIDATTMHNTTWRTMRARSLKEMTESSLTVAYDPRVLSQINALINVEQAITVHFPDGSSWTFYGYLRTFEPGENQEGEQPEADITIQPTNWDPDNSAEEGPVYGSAS